MLGAVLEPSIFRVFPDGAIEAVILPGTFFVYQAVMHVVVVDHLRVSAGQGDLSEVQFAVIAVGVGGAQVAQGELVDCIALAALQGQVVISREKVEKWQAKRRKNHGPQASIRALETSFRRRGAISCY